MHLPSRLSLLACALTLGLVASPAQTGTHAVNAASPTVTEQLRRAPQADRIDRHASLAPRTRLLGHRPDWATPDRQLASAVDPSTPLRLTVVLRRDPAVQAAFLQLLADQQDPASPLFRKWLTPQQLGELYGPTASDVDAFTAWAESEGLAVASVAPSRMLLELTAPVATVAGAFRTSFSRYRLDGKPRLSADTDPSLPTALMPVVSVISGFFEVPEVHQGHTELAQQTVSFSDAGPTPQYTNGTNHYLAPADFATIYNINSVYASGNTGQAIGSTPQHIALIDEAPVFPQDIADYAVRIGLPSFHFNTIAVTTVDNPTLSDGESDLDVSRTIGTANGAVTDLLLSGASYGGIFTAASYNVNTLLDPVMSLSWGSCERSTSLTTVARWDTLFSAAAAEGISVFVSSGDSGADSCEAHGSAPTLPQTLNINALCASSYATCVGGTQFVDALNPSLYWSSTNAAGRESALSYIPEGAWNNASTALVSATGGGVSKFVPRPSWQTGPGVPAGSFRTVPDVSFSASTHDGYYTCRSLSCESFTFYSSGGTSASAPGMAAIAALLNTQAGVALGNLNPLIYRLANSANASQFFHDVNVASSGVANCDVTIPSLCNNSLSSPTSISGLSGYLVTDGYDLATGWGSLNVANFLAAAVPVNTTLTLAASTTSASVNLPLSLTATLTAAGSSVAAPAGGPSGTVQFYQSTSSTSLGTALGSPVPLTGNAATLANVTLPAGTIYVTAVYSGDSYFNASTSSPTAVTVAGAAQLASTSLLSKAAGGYQASITLTNSGSATAQNVQLLTAVLGSSAGVPLPLSLGDLAPGAAVTLTLVFPLSAGDDGTRTVERLTGTYTSGTFGGSLRVTLP